MKLETLYADLFQKPFLIAGNCALETEQLTREVAASLRDTAAYLNINVIFKGSYTKASRTRQNSYHGVGLDEGLNLLQMVKDDYGLPVTSDVHEVAEVEKAAEVLDIIQIPALLCKNTHILQTAADTGKIVDIKKGHFVTANDMYYSADKVAAKGNSRILLTERGSLFGYGDTIVDFRSIEILKSFGYPVVFDATHSVRNTSRRSEDPEGGTPGAIDLLVRCAAVTGAHGLFVETHPAPQKALCDSVVTYPLDKLKSLMRDFITLQTTARKVLENKDHHTSVKMSRSAS